MSSRVRWAVRGQIPSYDLHLFLSDLYLYPFTPVSTGVSLVLYIITVRARLFGGTCWELGGDGGTDRIGLADCAVLDYPGGRALFTFLSWAPFPWSRSRSLTLACHHGHLVVKSATSKEIDDDNFYQLFTLLQRLPKNDGIYINWHNILHVCHILDFYSKIGRCHLLITAT